MMAELAVLAQWVKLSGTADEAISLRHIRTQLESLGFRTEILHHDAYISLPGASTVTVDNRDDTQYHALVLACVGRIRADRPPGPCRGGERSGFRGTRSDRMHRVGGRHRHAARSRRATLAGAAGQLHISPHEHLHEMCISPVWGNPSSVTSTSRTSRHRGVQYSAERGRQIAGEGQTRRATPGRSAHRGRYRMARDPDPAGRHGCPQQGGAVHFVLWSSRHLVSRRDGQRQRQCRDAGGRASLRLRARAVAARPAALFLVGTFARAVLRLHLVCR